MNSSSEATQRLGFHKECVIYVQHVPDAGPGGWQLTRRSRHLPKDPWKLIKSSIRQIVPMTSSVRMEAAVAKEHTV